MAHYRHPLVSALLSSMGAVFDRQVMRLAGRAVATPPKVIGYFGQASSVKHNRGGTAAAKRAARKRRNVIRNRRAHRA